MNKYDFLKAVGDIDSELIEQTGKARSYKNIFILAAAACICAVVSITLITAYNADSIAVNEPPTSSTEEMDTYISDTAPTGISASDIEISYQSGDKFVFIYCDNYIEPEFLGFAEYRFFNGIMGKSGILLTTSTEEHGKGYFYDMYYSAENDKLTLIAENYGYRTDTPSAVQKDLNGDGIKEFITNNTNLTNGGHNKMTVYTIKDNIPYAGYLTSVSFESDTFYDTDTGMVSYSYKSDFAFDNRYVPGTGEMTRKPLAYDMLTFEPFISSTANRSTDPFVLCRYGDFTVEYASFENGETKCVLCYKDDEKYIPYYGEYEMMPFSGILDYQGVSVTAFSDNGLYYNIVFYGVDKNDRLVLIGENYGLCGEDQSIYDNISVEDIDGDGIYELISDSVAGGDGKESVIVFRRDGDKVYAGHITPPAEITGSCGVHYNSESGKVEYRRGDGSAQYAEISITDADMTYYPVSDINNRDVIPDADKTDEWTADYDIWDTDKCAIYCGGIQKDIDLSDAAHTDREFSWDRALRPYKNIMGTDGAILSFIRAEGVQHELFCDYYFTEYDGKIICIAENYGKRSSDETGAFESIISFDTDGDGRDELITINRIIDEDRTDVAVYSFKDGISYAGKPDLPDKQALTDVRFVDEDSTLTGYFHFSDGTSEVIPIDEDHITFSPAKFPIN